MPKYMPEKRFSFISNSSALNQETFGVVQFSGVEGISLPYEFEIMLVSDTTDIDLDEVMAYPAKFTIHRKNGDDVDFHGILNSFEQLHKYNEYVFYRAHLVPRLWWLSITHHNQVCLNKSVPDIIALALKDSGLTKLDFEFKTRNTYKPIEYVCQYNESHFNFISRWLEREGLYYYFDQKGPAEKIIFTDTNIAHTNLPDVSYAPPEGLLEDENVEIINSFTCRQRQLPQKIFLKDYNYQRPSLGISGSADVDSKGRGTDYIYGEYFGTSEEGDRLAGIRAEILNCRRREFIGESTIPFIEPGYTFTLSNHYRESFNQQYLVESISHEGNQMGYLLPSIAEGVPEYKHTIYYRNSFTAIPSDVQFRAEKKSTRPYISGTLHAKIDAEGSGKYAELDDQGRYKVRLPFDESDDHKSGKASTWLRMMQPYANQAGGMQFPLTKGTEILLTFIDGDPDRPVIAGAIANPETPSPVSAKNQTESIIQTGGNNRIRMEDLEGKERIIMESPTANSWVRIGAPNDPDNNDPDYVVDSDPDNDVKISTENNNGIRIQSGENLWLESQKHGDYKKGLPGDAPPEVQQIIDEIKGFSPSNILIYNELSGNRGKYDSFANALINSHINVSNLDTFYYQKGNTYSFMGDWNYYMGSKYVENHMARSNVELNSKHEKDRADRGGPEPGSINCTNIGNLNSETWITKTFGGAIYEFARETKKLAVDYLTKEESHTYGKTTYEWIYRGDGTKKAYIMTNGPDDIFSEEKRWFQTDQNNYVYKKTIDRNFNTTEIVNRPGAGDLASYMYETFPPWFNYTAKASGMPTVKIVTSASSNETSILANASTKVDVNITGSLYFKLTAGVGFGIDIEANGGGKYCANLISGEHGGKWLGFTAQKAAALKAEKKDLVLDTLTTAVEQKVFDGQMSKMKLNQSDVSIALGMLFNGM